MRSARDRGRGAPHHEEAHARSDRELRGLINPGLLPQPGGFEGLLRLSESSEADHPSTTKLQHPTGCRLGLYAARLAAVVNAADEYGDVTDRHPVVHVRSNYLPGIVEVAEVLPGPVMATVNASLAQLGEERLPFDFWIGERKQPREVSPTQCVHDPLRLSECLLRHRLLPQPGGFEGLATREDPSTRVILPSTRV